MLMMFTPPVYNMLFAGVEWYDSSHPQSLDPWRDVLLRGGQERGRRDFETVVEHSGPHFHLELASIFQYSSRCIDSSPEPYQSRDYYHL